MKYVSLIKLLVLFIICLFAIPLFLYYKTFGSALSTDHGKWGQFSDFMNIFVSIANLIVSIAIAVGLYVFQNIYNENNDKTKEARNIEDRKIRQAKFDQSQIKYLNDLMQESIRFAEKTLKTIEEYQFNLILNPINLPTLNTHTIVYLELLAKDLDKDKYYHTYNRVFNKRDFFELFIPFSVIYGNYTRFLVSHESFVGGNYELKTKNGNYASALIEELSKHIFLLREEGNRYSVESKIFNNSVFMYYDIIEDNPQNIFDFRANIYIPVLEYLLDNRIHYEDRYSKLASLAKSANKSLFPVEKKTEDFLNYLKTLQERLLEDLNKAKGVVEHVRTYADDLS